MFINLLFSHDECTSKVFFRGKQLSNGMLHLQHYRAQAKIVHGCQLTEQLMHW